MEKEQIAPINTPLGTKQRNEIRDKLAKEAETEEITEKFFKRRFPEKDILFEKECGYFREWVERFLSGHPEKYMDDISLKVWKEMKGGNKK